MPTVSCLIVRSVLFVVITHNIEFAFGDVMFVANLSPAGIYSSNSDLNDNDLLDFTTAIPTALTRPVALDYDPYNSTIYWSDVTKSTIERYSFVTNEHEVLVSYESYAVDGIFVDGIGQKLYWTSTGENRIEVSNLDGTDRTILFDMGLIEPRAIELDSINGYLYWTDWGSGNEMIERAKLDDLSTRSQLVTTDLVYPNGLVLSVSDGKMYWCDAGTEVIEEANLDGSNRIKLIDIPGLFPFDIDIYENSLYWSDWTGGIYRVDISTGNVTVKSTDSRLSKPGGIYIYKDPTCSLTCENDGSCYYDDNEGLDKCFCLDGFTGETCRRHTAYCECPGQPEN